MNPGLWPSCSSAPPPAKVPYRLYAFHIAESQAFIDGNKRTAIASALAFIALNVVMRKPSQADLDALYAAMIAIARHELDKAGLAALLRRLFA